MTAKEMYQFSKPNTFPSKIGLRTFSILLVILGIAYLLTIPCSLGTQINKDNIIFPPYTFETRQAEKLPVGPPSENNRPISEFVSLKPVQKISYTSPHAVLSLSGTLGDKGWYTSDVECSLYATGDGSESVTTEYALYNKGWKKYSEPFLIYEEGQTTIYYRVRNDATGFIGETKFQAIDLDKTPPNGSIIINENAENTFSTQVKLTLSIIDASSGPTTLPPPGYIWGVPSGPSKIRFSNDGIFWSGWEPIAEEMTWILEPGKGIKTVYAQARDNAGLISTQFSDKINLITTNDNNPPSTKILLSGKQNSLGIYTSATAVTLSATDDISGVNLTEYSFDEHNWTKYTAPLPIYNEGKITIYYRSHDLEGNIESTQSHTITIQKEQEPNSVSQIIILGISAIVVVAILTIFILQKRKRQNRIDPQKAQTSFPT